MLWQCAFDPEIWNEDPPFFFLKIHSNICDYLIDGYGIANLLQATAWSRLRNYQNMLCSCIIPSPTSNCVTVVGHPST